MPEFETSYFGKIAYEEDSVLRFPMGLLGFERETRFLALEQAANQPLVFLQSLSQPDLCFITLPVLTIDAGYRLALAGEDLAALGFSTERQPVIGSDVLCLAILALNPDADPTANLLAPVVVHLQTRCALQAIQTEPGYSHRHALLPTSREDACL